jgi:ABC-type lipoprotein export system ATPase subunit
VHRPLLVLADEPTGNLDIDAAKTVLGLLRRLAEESDTTVVMATHSDEAAERADRILTLRDGHLVQSDYGR